MKNVIVLITMLFSFSALSQVTNEWVINQKKRSLRYLLDNISRNDTPKGFVVASPSKHSPNYYYHWVRDAALVMRALDLTIKNRNHLNKLMDDYINLVNHHQKTHKLTGQGEPKFNPNGTSFKGPWGRPQNDGPALRAFALGIHALNLIKQGKTNYVRAKLYGGKIPANTVIKRDLEYVSHNWKYSDFDLWEEVMGTHFYTRMAQRSALLIGAKLANKLNDGAAASWYLSQAKQIDNQLNYHFSSQRRYIQTTLNRVGGLNYKSSNLDASTILAVNHVWMPGLSYGPTDSRVIATYEKLVQTFKKIYPINKKFKGVAIGRYPEDTYYGGNPWFLLTNAMAEYLKKLSKHLNKNVKVDSLNNSFYSRHIGYRLNSGNKLSGDELKVIRKSIREEAKTFLERVKTHMGPDGRMDEQLDKFSGHMKGARDLTWSYASFLTI